MGKDLEAHINEVSCKRGLFEGGIVWLQHIVILRMRWLKTLC